MSDAPRIPRYGQANFAYLSRMAATPADEDSPVFMVNLMKYRAVADYADGTHAARSGRDADAEYAPTAILRKIGAETVFLADVERQILGDAPKWDRFGIVKYPTRASFLAMRKRADFQEKHVPKEAGMEETIALACTPMALPAFPEPGRVELAPGDAPFVMMHVMKYAPGGRNAMTAYGASAGAAGLALGVRPKAFFAVEGTVLGDGREWDEVRLNRFPSHAVFDELRANTTHQAGQPGRREALSDTYTLMLRPTIEGIAAG